MTASTSRRADNEAAVTLRPIRRADGSLFFIIATYTWVSGPLTNQHDSVNFHDWPTALDAIWRQSAIIRTVYVVSLRGDLSRSYSDAARRIR